MGNAFDVVVYLPLLLSVRLIRLPDMYSYIRECSLHRPSLGCRSRSAGASDGSSASPRDARGEFGSALERRSRNPVPPSRGVPGIRLHPRASPSLECARTGTRVDATTPTTMGVGVAILISVVPLSVPLPPTLFFSLPSRSPPTLPLAYDARRLSRAGVFYVLLTAKTGPPMRRAARAGASRAVADQDRSHAPNPISMLARGSRTPSRSLPADVSLARNDQSFARCVLGHLGWRRPGKLPCWKLAHSPSSHPSGSLSSSRRAAACAWTSLPHGNKLT